MSDIFDVSWAFVPSQIQAHPWDRPKRHVALIQKIWTNPSKMEHVQLMFYLGPLCIFVKTHGTTEIYLVIHVRLASKCATSPQNANEMKQEMRNPQEETTRSKWNGRSKSVPRSHRSANEKVMHFPESLHFFHVRSAFPRELVEQLCEESPSSTRDVVLASLIGWVEHVFAASLLEPITWTVKWNVKKNGKVGKKQK